MVDFSGQFKELPFRGGIDNRREKALLNFGDFSRIQNMRPRHDGFEQRKGQIEKNTVGDASTEILTMFQFSKGNITEIKLYAQYADGSVQLATDNPPTVTTGAFGTDKLAAISGALPASWDQIDDTVIFSDGVRQHQLNGGSTGQIVKFIVYTGTVAIPNIPDEGNDFTREVRDGDATSVAILDSLDTLANFDAIFIKTKIRANGFNFTLNGAKVNGNTSVLTVSYKSASGWTAVSGLSDGTSSGGNTMAQTGSITWTYPTDEVDTFLFGESGFWIRLTVSAALDSEVEISTVTFESDFHALQNVFSGVLPNAIEVFLLENSNNDIVLQRWATGLTKTSGISEASDGTVWLVDSGVEGSADIFHKNADGTAVTSFDISSTTSDADAAVPLGIAVDPNDGSLWICTRNTGSTAGHIFHVSVTGTLTAKIAATTFDSAAQNLQGVDVDPSDATLWIVDNDTDRMYHTQADGTLIKSWKTTDFNGTNNPSGIAAETEGSITLVFNKTDSGTKIGSTKRYYFNDQGDPAVMGGGSVFPSFENTTTILDGVSRRDSNGRLWFCHSVDNFAWRFETKSEFYRWPPSLVEFGNNVANEDFMYFNFTQRIEGLYWEVLEDRVNSTPSGTVKVEFWNGTAWTQVSNIEDGTSNFLKSGFVTWDRQSDATKRQFGTSRFFSFWYRLSVDSQISSARGGLFVLPYYDINDLGKLGRVNTTWNLRSVYSFDFFPSFIYMSAVTEPMVLNGDDFALFQVGDGRSNAVIAADKLEDKLLVWQEEKGVAGGTLTSFQGNTPTNITKTIISKEFGAVNSKAVVVVEGVERGSNFFSSTQTQFSAFAFFISREGIMATDGLTVTRISDKIQNFFDKTKSEVITRGQESRHYISFDSVYNVLRVGLVSGSGATVPNIFLVYDLRDKEWMTDTPAQALSFITDIEAASGDVPVLSVGGGAATGKTYLLNNSDDDVSTPVDADVIMELGLNGLAFRIRDEILIAKAQTVGNITRTIARNTNSSFIHGQALSMVVDAANDVMVRRRLTDVNVEGNHLSVRWRNNNLSEKMYLLKYNLRTELIDGTK